MTSRGDLLAPRSLVLLLRMKMTPYLIGLRSMYLAVEGNKTDRVIALAKIVQYAASDTDDIALALDTDDWTVARMTQVRVRAGFEVVTQRD